MLNAPPQTTDDPNKVKQSEATESNQHQVAQYRHAMAQREKVDCLQDVEAEEWLKMKEENQRDDSATRGNYGEPRAWRWLHNWEWSS